MQNETIPVLYILMRTDLPSMNPGKAMAQASHASNAFVYEMNQAEEEGLDTFEPSLEDVHVLFKEWQKQTPQGFGTVLVLGVTESELITAVETATMLGAAGNLVVDPTYPAHLDREAVDPEDPKWTLPCIPAGDKMVTFRTEVTCGYLFGDKNNWMLSAVLNNFKLHS